MKTYFRPAGFEAVEVPVLPNGRTDFSKIPDGVSALVVQSPNFAGVIEDLEAAAKAAHDKGILLIASFSEAMAWGLLKNSGSCGADIVSGEGNRQIFEDRKSTRLNSSHARISYAVFCLKKKNHT